MLLIKRIIMIFILLNLTNIGYCFATENNFKKDKFKKTVNKTQFGEDFFKKKEIILKIPVAMDNGSVRNIFITKSGRILVVFFKGKSVLYFDKQGNFIKSIGREGAGPGEFNRPWYLNEIKGNIIIGDFITFRISLFDKQGNFIKNINLHHQVNSLSVVKDSLFVVDDYMDAKYRKKHDVYVYDLSGNLISKFGELSHAGKELRYIPFRPQGPHVISIGENIFQTDYCDYMIKKYDLSGNLKKIFGVKPEGWKSLLKTPYKGLRPSMGWGALDKYWPKFYKCSMVQWICGINAGYLISYFYLNTNGKAGYKNSKIAVYKDNGKLIHPGLLIKAIYSSDENNNNISLLPIPGTGFGLWIYPENDKEILSNDKNRIIKIKLQVFYLNEK